MNNISTEQKESEKLQTLKKLAATVYLCQALTFMLAGLPLLLGVAINFYKRNEAQGTWLESHFNWQIKTVWITLAGFAVSGLTLEMGIGFFTLIATVVLLVYRIVIGWNALNDDKPVNQVN
ncbi:MAG: hypothetical protein LUP98_05820 [Methylococcaceae bacterium]|nr:hypothetical protein [Methylococcaceae bacterium]